MEVRRVLEGEGKQMTQSPHQLPTSKYSSPEEDAPQGQVHRARCFTETAERETGAQGADESQPALMARGKTTALSRELRYCRHVGRQCLHKPRAAFSCLLPYFCN